MRIVGIFIGLLILIWLSIEDRNELLVVLASGAVCAWIAARLLLIPPDSDRQLLIRHALAGIGAGALLVPIAILLMSIKNGIHSHITPDFSLDQMQSVLMRAPYFILSGFLIALGIGIWRLVKRDENESGGGT